MIGFVRKTPSQPAAAHHGEALRRFFARRVPAPDVDDLVQETMVRVQTVSASTRIVDIERYLFRTARNVLTDRYRSDRSEQAARAHVTFMADSEANDLTPERIVMARDEFARMRQIVLGMPERTRTAFLLRRFENLRYQEIARLMGISTNSVKDLLHRAILIVTAELKTMDRHDA